MSRFNASGNASNRSHWVMAAIAMALPLAWIGVQSQGEPLYVMPGSHVFPVPHGASVASVASDAGVIRAAPIAAAWMNERAVDTAYLGVVFAAARTHAPAPYGMLVHAGVPKRASSSDSALDDALDAAAVQVPLLASTQPR